MHSTPVKHGKAKAGQQLAHDFGIANFTHGNARWQVLDRGQLLYFGR